MISSSIFVSPHDDDHALFGAFTCLREAPILVVVFDSFTQAKRGLPATHEIRMLETRKAATILGCNVIIRLGFRDDDDSITPHQIRSRLGELLGGIGTRRIRRIFSPAFEIGGHKHHNLVATTFGMPIPDLPQRDPMITYYATYTTSGKTESGYAVPILDGTWIQKKLQSLACYPSQMNLDPRMGCWPHFLRAQEEYYL